MESRVERSLVERAQSGDRDAFAALVALEPDDLDRHVRVRLGAHLRERIDVEDILQETYSRALRSIAEFCWRGERSFQAWLRRIAELVILEAARKKRRDQVIFLDRDVAAREPTPSKRMRRDERHDRFDRALRKLPDDYREVVRLSRIEGLRLQEIAERMNRSPKAVSHLLSRAMQRLKEEFVDTESLRLGSRRFGAGEDRDG